jgi:hypothetical protein
VKEAVVGWGTDTSKLIKVLCSLSKRQVKCSSYNMSDYAVYMTNNNNYYTNSIFVWFKLNILQLLRVNEIYKEKNSYTLREEIERELVGFFGSSSHFKYFMQLLLRYYTTYIYVL